MGIDAAGKRQIILGVENLLALLGADVRGNPIDLAVPNRDVEAIDRRLVRPHDACILDHKVKRLSHFDIFLLASQAAVAMTRDEPCAVEKVEQCQRRTSPLLPAG
jgi:hypothetical protein